MGSILLRFHYDCTYCIMPRQLKRRQKMPSMRIARMSDLKTAPWKNGGGVTREIAVCRSGDQLAWRLSMADVAIDGPFSRFEGLVSAEGSQAAVYGLPVRFDGALGIESKLREGPLRDLNLMFNPMQCEGAVTLIKGPHDQVLSASAKLSCAVFALRGAAQINNAIRLSAGDTMLLDKGSAQLDLAEHAAVLLISLEWQAQIDASSSVIATR
jgi:uncharacterized protein